MKYLRVIGLTVFFGFFIMMPLSAQRQRDAYFNHVISKGETLYSIAAMYNVPKEEIIRLNPSCVAGIKWGETLRIPQNTASSSIHYYTIRKGDTLYGVARQYNTSVDKLTAANPGLTPETFSEGKVIRVFNMPVGSAESRNQAPTQSLSSNCREIHKAKRKDTPEKVAEKYHLSLQALIEANPEMKKVGYKMKKGDLLCIPYQDKQAIKSTWKLPAARPLTDLKVGVVLPFKSTNKMEQSRMIEYYRGILMAADSLKSLGHNVELFAYNSGTTPADMQSVLSEAGLQKCNLIFGPFYAAQLPVLAEFSNRLNCTVVAPFASSNDKVYSCKNLFLVNPSKSYQYSSVYDSFIKMFKGQRIIFYSVSPNSSTEATDFIIGLKQALRNARVDFRVMSEHASEGQMLNLLDLQTSNVIVPTSYGITALNTLMTKFKAFMQAHPSYKFQLLGYPDWQAFSQYHLNNYYFMDTFIYTSYYNTSWRKRNLQFVKEYESSFHTEMLNTHPKYPMLGFDTGFYFMKGMTTYGSSFIYHLKDINTEPYQSDFSFMRVNNWGGFVNGEVKFIHYTRKRTTEILDFTK